MKIKSRESAVLRVLQDTADGAGISRASEAEMCVRLGRRGPRSRTVQYALAGLRERGLIAVSYDTRRARMITLLG